MSTQDLIKEAVEKLALAEGEALERQIRAYMEFTGLPMEQLEIVKYPDGTTSIRARHSQ